MTIPELIAGWRASAAAMRAVKHGNRTAALRLTRCAGELEAAWREHTEKVLLPRLESGPPPETADLFPGKVVLHVHTDNQNRMEELIVYGETTEELAGNAFVAGIRYHQANPGYRVDSTSLESPEPEPASEKDA